ncbi:hypothetical protein VO64_1753 [Pseudomonas synxantha]|uniref:Uncharacterized protein n=1 Tax=Pseudomonas synxantha TaxID=47883 RepID=A0AAU8TP41_9PSED|nr:hypothetical protein VO64_1753 [Pseudomonas synxantha]
MPNAIAVLKPKYFHGGDRLKTPAAEVASHLKWVHYRITINVPPRLLFTAPVQLWIPMLHERQQ